MRDESVFTHKSVIVEMSLSHVLTPRVPRAHNASHNTRKRKIWLVYLFKLEFCFSHWERDAAER